MFNSRKTLLAALLTLLIPVITSCRKELEVWNDPEIWYESSKAYDKSKTDVFYIVSTEVLSAVDENGDVSWQSMLVPADKDAMKGEMAWVEKNMFHDDFNLFAPYYHQFTFDAIWQTGKAEFNEVYKRVADEVCAAFDHYMENDNEGRPFILAGFSQGAMLTLDVLKHMSDEQYSRMVACYTMGYRLSEEDLHHPHIKAASGENGKGVVISFNSTQTREAIWPLLSEGAAACMNPINWKTDSTPAVFEFNGTTNTVHVDPQAQVLLVDTDDPDYYHSYYDLAGFFLDAGVSRDNLHHWDLLFYAENIHDNAVLRTR